MPDHEHVSPQDPGLENSPTVSKDEAGERPQLNTFGMHEPCYWNDKKYSDGATVCESHRLYECWNGKWVAVSQC